MPRHIRTALCVLAVIGMTGCRSEALAQDDGLLVRVAEIEVHARYLEEYRAALTEEAEASVRLEPGVISIFPMYQKEKATRIRILEIYANRAAYDSHLTSPHFLKYKSTTLKMVKFLTLVEMDALDAHSMPQVFAKMRDAR
jgi:quinol monooxygenase YgiN